MNQRIERMELTSGKWTTVIEIAQSDVKEVSDGATIRTIDRRPTRVVAILQDGTNGNKYAMDMDATWEDVKALKGKITRLEHQVEEQAKQIAHLKAAGILPADSTSASTSQPGSTSKSKSKTRSKAKAEA